MVTPEASQVKPSARMDLLEANAQRSQELKADARAKEALPRREIKMTAEKKTLAAKIAAISKDLGAIRKAGHNKEQGYDFIEYAAVSGKLRELLDKHGVAIIPSVVDRERDDITSKYGARGYHYTLKMHFTIVNADDKEDTIESDWLGESTDYGDKGVNKAETSGVKYFYMRLFNISEKSDADNDPDASSGSFEETKPTKAKKNVKADPRLNFDTIRETCAGIDDIESLENYWREVAGLKPSAGAVPYIKDIFAKRKAEIGGDNA